VAAWSRCRSAGEPALILALLSGILLALSFPRYGHPLIAWVALAPLITALFDDRYVGRVLLSRPGVGGSIEQDPPYVRNSSILNRAFLLGFTTGAAYFGGTVYWTGTVVREFGGLSWPVAVIVAALLVAYLALFPGLFALCLGWLGSKIGRRAIMLAPAIWVSTELARTYFWSGFPWVLLGYSQAPVLPIAQVASIVGVYGLSALVAGVGAALSFFALSQSHRSTVSGTPRGLAGERRAPATLAAVAAVVVAVAVWGHYRLRHDVLTRQGTPVRVALIQGNIPQDQKWDPAHAQTILNTYLGLTRDSARQGAELVIWPESSTPFFFEEDHFGAARILEVVKDTGIELLLGRDQMAHTKPPAFYNAAFLIRTDGSVPKVYRKMHLVPFGEFVPLKDLLFFVGPLVEAAGEFTPGESMVMLPTRHGPISTAICYEIVYPGLVRRSVLEGSQLLTTITNDAWYGHSSAPFQHFQQASLRAIEQGRYLVRAANTGISGIVDPYGRILEQSRIFEQAGLVGEARMLDGLTIYGKIGDAFAYVCVALTLAALLAASVSSRTQSSGQKAQGEP
jgi:apolipoprotein N-acyltransferase